MRGSESKNVVEGLPEERKALALRYTIDAAEAKRREKPDVGARATQAPSATGSRTEEFEVAPPRPAAASPATAPQRSNLVSSLKERLRRARNHQDIRVAASHVRDRASDSTETPLRCARCGHECTDKANDWTLRLFGDDQLHPVCRGCDERDFSEARQGGPLSVRPLAE